MNASPADLMFVPPGAGPLIHHDAPERLRVGTMSVLHDQLDRQPSWIRDIVCGVRRVRLAVAALCSYRIAKQENE